MKSPPRRRGSLLPILLTAALWLPCASLPAFGQLLQDSALPRAPDADSRDAEEVTSPSGSGPPVAEGNISLNLRDVPIARVLDLFTEQRGLNIVTSDSVQGKVTVKLDNVPWEQALATILRTRGMGFQKNGEIIQVDTLERLNTETVTRVFEVEHLGVNEAKELATGVLTPAGKLHVLSRSGSGDAQGATMLVVTDTEGALARVQALLEKVDVRPATDRLELIGPDASGRFRVNIRNQQFARVFDQLRRQFGINIMLDGPVDGRLDLSLSGVTEDELIDSILGGSPLRYLKDGRTYHVSTALQFKERLTTRLFQLHFVDAEDVKRFLAPHLSPLGKVEVFTRRARQGFTFGTQTTSRRATGAANPSPERSDTVAVTDTPAALENIAALVAALDVRPQQVSIEVRIVEVTLDHGETMGIDWSVTGRFAGATKPTLLPFKTANASSTPSGDTFRFGTISAQDFTAVLQALSHRNRLKILSNPRISTLNNQEASILIGDKFPITVETIDPQTAVRTVSLDHYEQIGVQLQVVPQISGVQSVNLIIHPAVSTVGPLIQNQFPVISTREADTQILVRSGDTAVIGGLLQERSTKNHSQLPGFSQLPLVGGLFNSDTDTTVTVDLLIFVTPQIVPELAAAATEPATAVVLEPAPRAPAKPVRTTLAVPVPRERTVKASAPLGTELVGGRVPRSLSSTDKPGPSRSEEPARSEAAAPSWLSASAEPSVATTTPDAPRAQSWRRRFARVPRKPHASAPDPD